MPLHTVLHPITCDHSMTANLPRAHAECRVCPATGLSYWTVDTDPSDACPAHQHDFANYPCNPANKDKQ